MQLLCILLAANRVHTVNFQAFLPSDEFSICLVTIFVFVFCDIYICVVRYLYTSISQQCSRCFGTKTSNHSSDSPYPKNNLKPNMRLVFCLIALYLRFSSHQQSCLRLKYSLSAMYIELVFQLSFLILVSINIMRWPLPWYHTVVKTSTSNRVF